MAVLQSDKLSFEFQYIGFDFEWVQYQFYFKWCGEPVIRDELLKRHGLYWESREKYAFLAEQDECDNFLPFLKKVLESNKADYWEPIEPDIIVALYPDDYFPFLPSHYQLIYESKESREKRVERDILKEQGIKLPNDMFTFMVSVDAYNFKDADAYYGQGFAMHMIVSRTKLEQFIVELEKEYIQFRKKFKIDEHINDNKK